MFAGHRKIDDVMTFYVQCLDKSGAVAAPAAAPTAKIYEETTSTELLSITMTQMGALTGYYYGQATLSAANGFEAGKDYSIRITATVDSVATAMLQYFTMESAVADVRHWIGSVPNALASGRVDADMGAVSADSGAADNLETMLDGTGGQILSLGQLRINAAAAGGGIDIDNSAGPAISATSASAGAAGIEAQGNGGGAGIKATGGATGHGLLATGGATSGDGIRANGTASGYGLRAVGAGNNGGIAAIGGSLGAGIFAQGGSVAGAGISAVADGSGAGFQATGQGSSAGIEGTGAGAGAGMVLVGGLTGHGLHASSGVTSGSGIRAEAQGDGPGLHCRGAATLTHADGILSEVTGAGTGDGIHAVGHNGGHGILGEGDGAGTGSGMALIGDAGGAAGLTVQGSGGNEPLNSITAAQIADAVWDEATGGHVLAGSFGQSLQPIENGTVQAAGGSDGISTVRLAAGASAAQEFYTGNWIHIVAGTGAKQIRLITGYDSGTKIARVSPEFKVPLDGTSIYVIVRNTGAPLPVRSGFAQAGGAATITLDAGASAVNNFYNGLLIFITNGTAVGTGAGQARIITAYNGTSKVATVSPPWTATATPDATSAFVLLANVGSPAAQSAGAVWDEARAGHVAAGSFGEGVASVQGAVTGDLGGNVVGNVNGNVVGSVGSVLGSVNSVTSPVTVGTNNDKTGYGLAANAVDVAEFTQGAADKVWATAVRALTDKDGFRLSSTGVDDVWDENIVAAHAGADTAGLTLSQLTKRSVVFGTECVQGSLLRQLADDGVSTFDRTTDSLQQIRDNLAGAGPSAAAIATAVWDEPTATVRVPASYGQLLKDDIDASVSSRASAVALAAVQADTDDIQTRLPATLSGGRMRSQVEGMDAGTVTAAAIATNAVDADALAADAVTEIQAGLATAVALATVQADTDDIQTRLPAALVGGRMDSSVGAMAANVLTAAAIAADAGEEIIAAVSGLADAGSTALTIVDAARTEADADYWKDMIAYMVTGAAAGQARRISAFNPATDTLTVDTAFTQPIAAGDQYLILRTAILQAAAAGTTDWTDGERSQIRQALGVAGAVAATDGTGDLKTLTAALQADTNDIQARLPATLTGGGLMRSQVEGMDPGTVTAAAVATDAFDADAVAADAVAEFQAGLATAAALAVVQADTDDLQARIPATLNAGRMRSHVEACDPPCVPAGGGGGSPAFEITEG